MTTFNLYAPPAELSERLYHVARLNTEKFSIAEAEPPVYLYRGDPKEDLFKRRALEQQLAHEAAMKKQLGVDEEDLDGSMRVDHAASTAVVGAAKEDPGQAAPAVGADDAAKRKPATTAAAAGGNKYNKSKVYYATKSWEDQVTRRRRHRYPWLLEDAVGHVNFVGKVEDVEDNNYVLFVSNPAQGDGFTVIPVSELYRFQPRITYRTLNIEETEQQWEKSKKGGVDRWMMRRRPQEEGGVEQEKGVTTHRRTMMLTKGETGLNRRRRRAEMRGDDDELAEFDDQVDDDEEFEDDEADELGLKEELQERKKNQHKDLFGDDSDDDNDDENSDDDEDGDGMETKEELKKDAKNLSALLKKMKQNFSASPDDDMDPYSRVADATGNDDFGSDISDLSSTSSSVSMSVGREKTDKKPSVVAKPPEQKPSSTTTTAVQAKRKLGALREDTANSSGARTREGSPAMSEVSTASASTTTSTTRPSKRARQSRDTTPSLPEGPNMITRAEVVALFKENQGRVSSIKAVVSHFAKKLKKNEQNKKVLMSLLKELATKEADGGFSLIK